MENDYNDFIKPVSGCKGRPLSKFCYLSQILLDFLSLSKYEGWIKDCFEKMVRGVPPPNPKYLSLAYWPKVFIYRYRFFGC